MNDTSDWFEVEQIADDTYQITEGTGVLPCNMFLIDGGDEALLIDTGLGIGNLQALIEDLVGDNIRVLLTHSHWDHIGAAHQFDEVFINGRERASDGTVSLYVLEDDYDQRPQQFMTNWLEQGLPLPDGFDPQTYDIEPVDNVGTVEAGEELIVGDHRLELIPIPGHTPGQLAVLDRDIGVCFAADVIEPGVEVYAHFEDSDLAVYRESIDRLLELRNQDAFDVLTIGHGDPIRGDDLSVLDEVEDALNAVAAGETSFELIDTSWGPTREYTVNDITVLTPGSHNDANT